MSAQIAGVTLLGAAFPVELEVSSSEALAMVKNDVIFFAANQINASLPGLISVASAVFDDKLTANEHPRTVITDSLEEVLA